MKSPTPLVLIERTGSGLNQVKYSRILNKVVTHAATSEDPLERADVEAFRVDPDKVLGDQEAA